MVSIFLLKEKRVECILGLEAEYVRIEHWGPRLTFALPLSVLSFVVIDGGLLTI